MSHPAAPGAEWSDHFQLPSSGLQYPQAAVSRQQQQQNRNGDRSHEDSGRSSERSTATYSQGHGRDRSKRSSSRSGRSSRSHRHKRSRRSRSHSGSYSRDRHRRKRSRSHSRRHRRHTRSRSRSRSNERHRRSRSRKTRSRSRSRSRSSESNGACTLPHHEVPKDQNYIKKVYAKNDYVPSVENTFKNDGSFLEMFKKMQEEQEETKKAEEASANEAKKIPVFGKRRGGRILKTGVVQKQRVGEEIDEEEPKDAWSMYMKEVRKYKEACCDDDSKTRPLVK